MTHLLLRKVLVAAGLSLFIIFPGFGNKWFRLVGIAVGRVARSRYVAMAVVGLTSLTLSTLLGTLLQIPLPYAQDEFSYLLAADTFAHGRLANPTHPMWEHFETFHVIQQPTYASKYPPGQGLALAMGQKLSGYPILGVWITTALSCAAVCWMMYAWLPPRWAFTGSLLTAVHPLLIGWSQSFWGGSLALGGGALVLGALGRLLRSPSSPYHGVALALGITVLANTRPYEGGVLSSLVVGILLWKFLAGRLPASRLKPMLAPFVLVLLLTIAAIAFYNFRVTGNLLRLPYLVHEARYAITPLFIWQPVRPEPSYRHPVLREFHVDFEITAYRQQASLHGWMWTTWGKYVALATIHFPTAFGHLLLVVLLLAIPAAVRKDSQLALLLFLLLAFVVGTLPEIFMSHRYTAPAASLLFLTVLRALRHVRLWRWHGSPLGRSLIRVCLLACIIAFLVTTVRAFTPPSEGLDPHQWAVNRAATLGHLNRQDGQHLVLVRYGPKHSPHLEWVYNEADIDRARVVWAREMDPNRNRMLLQYFKRRHVWLLAVDDDAEKPNLTPYPDQSQ